MTAFAELTVWHFAACLAVVIVAGFAWSAAVNWRAIRADLDASRSARSRFFKVTDGATPTPSESLDRTTVGDD